MSEPVAYFLGIVVAIAVLSVSLSWMMSSAESLPTTTASFLQYAADGQQQEIALGHLAMQKSKSEEIKQFEARLITDYEKAHREVQQLAAKGGLQLSSQPSESHAQMKHQLECCRGVNSIVHTSPPCSSNMRRR